MNKKTDGQIKRDYLDTFKISIIVPIYMVESYLRKCIDTIILQTYNNIEIILVDDGSLDNCGAICDEYAQQDNRIIVIHKENGGLSSARNAALDIVTGDYIMFVDSDDWVEPYFCEVALRTIIEKNVPIVSFGFTKSLPSQLFVTSNPRILDASEAIKHLILYDDSVFNYVWNKIFRRDIFDQIRFPMGVEFEDQIVTYKLIHKAQKIFISDSVLYHYVTRKGSISFQWFTPKSIATRYLLWKNRLEDIKVICPKNEIFQIIQLANEAVEGYIYIDKKGIYGNVWRDMGKFLSLNREKILGSRATLKIKLYYHVKPILRGLKFVRRIRDSVVMYSTQ